MIKTLATLLAIALVVGLNLSIWSYVNNPLQLQPWTSTTMGVTFDPTRKEEDSRKVQSYNEADIDEDLALLEGKFHAVRTYSVLKGLHKIPELSVKHNLNVTMGAWISGDLEKNRQELEELIQLSNQENPKIVRLMVGNEVLLRTNATQAEIKENAKKIDINSLSKHITFSKEELKQISAAKNFPIPRTPFSVAWEQKLQHPEIVKELLINYIREVKKRTWRPVSTSETWDQWLANPELADEVDYIGVHILPFWEGIAVDDAVDYVFDRYHHLQLAFPNKPIVITEVGWPSDGQPFKHAIASKVNQAKFLREFLNRAAEDKLAYYVIEAFDQPWKRADEGSAGAYWGLFNADRQLKFPMDGEVIALPAWKHWAIGAAVFIIILMGLFLFSRKNLRLPGILFFGLFANLAASLLFWTVSIGWQQYQTPVTIVFWVTLIVMQVLTLILILVETLEVVEVLWRPGNPERAFKPFDIGKLPSDYHFPKVSVHLPIHNEPPEMVKKTLANLAKLDYPDYEILVMDNNTKDPAIWKPVEEECTKLGEKFRFFHREGVKGFKAGALKILCYGETVVSPKTGSEEFANAVMHPDAEIIALIDSDYQVEPNWLKSMVPFFYKPNDDQRPVGFVQSPQDYRDGKHSTFASWCYWEYAGFFHIGMVQRNYFNAVIQHGTMTMVSKEALVDNAIVLEKETNEKSHLFKSIELNQAATKGYLDKAPDLDNEEVRRHYYWPTYTICEDSALGLNLYERGWDSVYCSESFGKGLMPDTMGGYKDQRFRWVYGGMRIFKHHRSALLSTLFGLFKKPVANKQDWHTYKLSRQQAYYFLAGWFTLVFRCGWLNSYLFQFNPDSSYAVRPAP